MWINNEYAYYTGKRGVCSFCGLSLPSNVLVEIDPIATATITRYAKSINAMPLMTGAIMCKDEITCDKWIAKKLEQANGKAV